TSFAGEAVAQRGIQFRRFERVAILKCPHPTLSLRERRACGSTAVRVPIGAQRERGANDIGASARGHDFFARRDERWAHDRPILAAAAAAVALLEIANER